MGERRFGLGLDRITRDEVEPDADAANDETAGNVDMAKGKRVCVVIISAHGPACQTAYLTRKPQFLGAQLMGELRILHEH